MSGHIFDMVNRIAQNKVSRRKKFKGDNREPMHSAKIIAETEYELPNASTADLEGIKEQIQQSNKSENRKSVLFLIVSLLLVGLIVWVIITFYDLTKHSQFG